MVGMVYGMYSLVLVIKFHRCPTNSVTNIDTGKASKGGVIDFATVP